MLETNFSFDPETDPLFSLLNIDYLALKAGEYKWLKKFYDEFLLTKNLDILPNYLYSVALAAWEQETLDEDDSHKESDLLLQKAMIICNLY